MKVYKVGKVLVLLETRDQLFVFNLLTHHDVVVELKGFF